MQASEFRIWVRALLRVFNRISVHLQIKNHPLLMNSFFDSLQAKKEIERLYDLKLEELPMAYEMLSVETSFGNTNIILTGEKGKPPLVVLHGSNACAPIALEAMVGLLDEFRIYAIDVVGQPNLSSEIRPSMENEEYGQWMFEILTRLSLWEVTLVGISFGGFISWKTLVFDERRIAKTVLIVPAGIVNGNPLILLWQVFLPIILYKRNKNKKHVHRFLNRLFTEPDNFAFAFLSKVLLHFEMDFSRIPLIKAEEARQIKSPLLIIGTDKDILFPGKRLLRRAEQIFPSLKQKVLLQSSKHVPSHRANLEIVEFIKNHST